MDLLSWMKEKVNTDIDAVKEDMAKGSAVTIEGYREQVGMVKALRRVKYWLDEAEKNLREDGDSE